MTLGAKRTIRTEGVMMLGAKRVVLAPSAITRLGLRNGWTEHFVRRGLAPSATFPNNQSMEKMIGN